MPRLGAAAVTLRTAGASYADIADTLGLATPNAALNVITEHLAIDIPVEDKDHMRREITAQLNELLTAVWIKATDPEHLEQLAAVGRAVSIIDRKVRLHGLDAPTELVVHTPTQTEIENWITHMVKGTMPALEEADIVDVEVVDE